MLRPSFANLSFQPYVLSRPASGLSFARSGRLMTFAISAANFLSGQGWNAYLPVEISSPGFQATALFPNGYMLRVETLIFPERFAEAGYPHCQFQSGDENRSLYHATLFYKDLASTEGLRRQAQMVPFDLAKLSTYPQAQQLVAAHLPFTANDVEDLIAHVAQRPEPRHAGLPLAKNIAIAPPVTCLFD